MPIKLASFSTIDHVCQCLLNNIEAENALSLGPFGDPEAPFGRFAQTPDPDELRASILETVDLLKHQLLERAAAVGRGRNSLLPFRRLPPEILSLAISYAMAEIDNHNHQKRLIQLSSVSRWWRTVILGNASLWGVIHSKDPERIVSLALDRSKTSPLTVLWEATSHTKNLTGGGSYRRSIGSDDFFKLVSPHAQRWRNIIFPKLGSGNTSTDWLTQHRIQISRHLQQLSLCWDGSPSTRNPVTGFSGLAERLSELKLHNLHVDSADITRILAASSRLVSLDLESLVVRDEQTNQPSEASHPTIELPCLTNLSLKWLPSSILDPIVQNLNPTAEVKVSIAHDMTTQKDPGTSPEPFASFIARQIKTQHEWVVVHPSSTNVTLGPLSATTTPYKVELRGPPSVVLRWLRLRSLPQTTRPYYVHLVINSQDLGSNPEPVVIENLKQFPKVGYITLFEHRESWRWIWLLSLPDAVQTPSVDQEMPVKSWLWPELEYISINGDYVDEFTILSVLLARYGARPTTESTTNPDDMPRRLKKIWVRPGSKAWRPEALDRIRELVAPGHFKLLK
ncbi:hypothetical protein M407DRAFT_27980 [Tulasnella calospora MUT 4182]|uniref:Uncharacterized protein n=1 Tax=Tulasnella calospora MUT 4182 TaxID=1051891 RepID=A0A0C3QCV6_9AGAM|nr:hypothetical protein M407DRAFT_27980 [Tulasnella calospora MUT 4182]